MKRYVLLFSGMAALGGLLFGFDTAVIAGTLGYLDGYFGLTPIRQGWIVSSALLGCIPGALVSGYLADRFGRKPVLLAAAVLYVISALWSGLAGSEAGLASARILGGLAIGFASTTAPIYIAEIAPTAWRGRLGMLTQLSINLGILLSYVSNFLIDNSPAVLDYLGGERNALWRPMFGVAALPSLLFLLALIPIPESPRWLLARGRRDEARRVFRKLEASDDEMNAVEAAGAAEQAPKFDRATFSTHRQVLWTGFFVMICCLLTGINVVLYYAPLIFEATRIAMPPLLQTTFTGVVLFIFTIAALGLIDRVGRRKLLLWGSWIMGLSMLGMSALFFFDKVDNYGILFLTLLYIATFAITWGAVIWVLVGEMFPNAVRGTGVSLANFGNWITNFFITLAFPWMLAQWGGSGSFLFYALTNLAAVWFVGRYIFETKGVDLEQMEHLYKKPSA